MWHAGLSLPTSDRYDVDTQTYTHVDAVVTAEVNTVCSGSDKGGDGFHAALSAPPPP